jgi:hypothetical protein
VIDKDDVYASQETVVAFFRAQLGRGRESNTRTPSAIEKSELSSDRSNITNEWSSREIEKSEFSSDQPVKPNVGGKAFTLRQVSASADALRRR